MIKRLLRAEGFNDIGPEGDAASGRHWGGWSVPFYCREFGRAPAGPRPAGAGSPRAAATTAARAAAGRTERPGGHRPAAVRARQGGAGPAPGLRARFDRYRRFLEAVERAALPSGRPSERQRRQLPRRPRPWLGPQPFWLSGAVLERLRILRDVERHLRDR